MTNMVKHKIYRIVIPLSILSIIIAVGYVRGQQADREIEIEIGKQAVKLEEPLAKLHDEAEKLLKAGKTAEAIAKYEEFLAQNPKGDHVPIVYLWIGGCYTWIGKPEQAIAQYEKIISGYPDFAYMPAVLYEMSIAYEISQDYDNALAKLQQIMETYPDTRMADQAQFTRGSIHYYQKKYETAIEEYKKVLTDETDKNKHWRGLALYMMGASYWGLKQYDEAIQVLQQRIKEFGADAQNAQTQLTLGHVYHSAKHYDEAIASYNKMMKNYPKDHNVPFALYSIGQSLEAQGRTQKAIEIYQRLIERYPNYKELAQKRIDFLFYQE